MNDDDIRELGELGNPDVVGFYPGEATARLQERQIKDIFFSSPEFKQAERERIERSKPKEHEVVGFNTVYCPNYDRVRPEWLCANECDGDVKETLDKEE